MSSEILLINKTTKEKLNKSQKAFNTNIRKVQTYTQRLEKGKEFLKGIEIKILKKLKEPREQILEDCLKLSADDWYGINATIKNPPASIPVPYTACGNTYSNIDYLYDLYIVN